MQPSNSLLTQTPVSLVRFFRGATANPAASINNPFFIRLRSWEYWPFTIVYIPVMVYWLWLSLKARSFFFFSAANPAIESGGMLGEEKKAILDKISDEFIPKTLLIPRHTDPATLYARLDSEGFFFPFMAKPNAGERGWRVEKIADWPQLLRYAQSSPIDFLLQAFVDYPLELGVFYYRMPGETQGTISSIVKKEFLAVRGNGRDCLETLILTNDRARLQWDVLKQTHAAELSLVLAPGETLTLVAIGNHCRGTKFLDASHLITPELERVFDRISLPIEGFYYGRYDLRCRSEADLYAGRHICILELNGAGAEPAHIYQPGFSIWAGWRVLLQHWHILYRISRENHRRGVAYMTFAQARQIYNRIKNN